MKKLQPHINNIVNITLIYACFYATEGKLNPTEWSDTIPETFAFYVMAYFIVRGFLKLKT